MSKLEEQVARVWIGYVRLVTEVVKDSLLGCMGKVLQWGLWQWMRRTGNKVGSDKELMVVAWEGGKGGQRRRLQVEGSDKW